MRRCIAIGGIGIERAIVRVMDLISSTPTAIAIATNITTNITIPTLPLYHLFTTYLAVDLL